MKILITGASGFVGRHLVRHYVGLGHEVIAMGRRAQPSSDTLLADQYLALDISKALPKLECDVCIHAAAKASEDGAWSCYEQINIQGTINVFEATISCNHFIFISSSSVYDRQQIQHIEKEKVDHTQLNKYGKSKRLAEDYLQKQKGKNITILRPRAIYGPKDTILLPRLLKMCKGRFLFLPNGLKIKTSLTSIFNLINSIDLAIKQASEGVSIYNIADEKSYTMGEVVHQICEKVLQKQLTPISIPLVLIKSWLKLKSKLGISGGLSANALDFIQQDNVLDISKIKKELGYTASHHFYIDLPLLG